VAPEIDLSKLTVAEKDALILSLLRKRFGDDTLWDALTV
jgi:hypothetical protein